MNLIDFQALPRGSPDSDFSGSSLIKMEGVLRFLVRAEAGAKGLFSLHRVRFC